MKQLQVLVATMHQSDFSLVEKMNITCDAILANQTDHNAVSEQVYPRSMQPRRNLCCLPMTM